MKRYRITTLVDITRTRPTRDEKNELKQKQQSNFNALIQAIGLRANIMSDRDPVMTEGRLPEPFNGKGKYWVYEFEPEREDPFLVKNDPVKLLVEDLNGVPIIDLLNNSSEFKVPVFVTTGDDVNTVVEII